MKRLFYGEIDLTKLGQIARQHEELVKKVNCKDGVHLIVKAVVLDKERTDEHGSTATLKVDCKREEERNGLNYFLGDYKPCTPKQQPQQPPQQAQGAKQPRGAQYTEENFNEVDNLPF